MPRYAFRIVSSRDPFTDLPTHDQTLIEATDAELVSLMNTAPAWIEYGRCSTFSAHRHVIVGGIHETRLYLDNGRVRYARAMGK